MKRFLIVLSVLVLFVVMQYLLPVVLSWYRIGNLLLYTVFGLISNISIPLIMLFSVREVRLVRHASLALLLTTIAFFILDVTNVTGAIAGYAYIILVASNLALFVSGIIIPEEFYFGRRAGVFLVLAAFTMFLRYAQPVQIVYTLVDEYNVYNELGWPVFAVFRWIYSALYLLTFLFELLALEAVLNEKQRIGYK